MVQTAIHSPDWTAVDPLGWQRRFKAIGSVGDRILRIVCEETDTEVRVIAVFFDRNARRPL